MRVLVVDNDRDTADTFAMLLKFAHCDVRVAYGGLAGLEEATRFEPHLLFADLAMPGMDGNELARQVRQCKQLDRTVLAALTGFADAHHRQLAAEAGFAEYLVKPVPLQTLQELLARVAQKIAESQEKIEESTRQVDLGSAMAARSLRPWWDRDSV